MRYFDTGIEKVTGENIEMDIDKLVSSLPEEDREKAKVTISNRINSQPMSIKAGENIIELHKDENGKFESCVVATS